MCFFSRAEKHTVLRIIFISFYSIVRTMLKIPTLSYIVGREIHTSQGDEKLFSITNFPPTCTRAVVAVGVNPQKVRVWPMCRVATQGANRQCSVEAERRGGIGATVATEATVGYTEMDGYGCRGCIRRNQHLPL